MILTKNNISIFSGILWIRGYIAECVIVLVSTVDS